MTGKTHMAIGLAGSSLILLPGVDIRTGLVGLAVSAIGSLMVDGDMEQSEAGDKINDFVQGMVLISGVLLFLKYKMNFNAFEALTQYMPAGFKLIGITLLIASIIYGRMSGHRYFMHSIFGLFTTSLGVYLIMGAFWKWFALGYALHILADLLNKKKVHLLYPLVPDFGIKFNVCGANGLVSKILMNASYAVLIYSIIIMK